MIKMTLFRVSFNDGEEKRMISWNQKILLDSLEKDSHKNVKSIEPLINLEGKSFTDIISQGKKYLI